MVHSLIKIDSVKKLKKLAPWYTKERYKNFKNAPLTFILDQLSIRRGILNSLETDSIFQLDIDEWLSVPSLRKSEYKPITPLDENVWPLSVKSVFQMNALLKSKEIDSFSEVYKTDVIHDIWGDKRTFIGLDLEHATDLEIIEEVKRFLIKTRIKLDAPDPKYSNKRNRKFLDLINIFYSRGVWEFIDLDLWARLNGHTFTDDFLANIIETDEYATNEKKGHTAKSISDQLRNKHVQIALSFDFSEQLSNYISNSK